jgi:pectinesterase
VFLDCKITADSSVNKLYLGRPWRAWSRTAFIRCELPAQIAAEGWNNWSNPENEKTAYYTEYKNSGPGAVTEKRVLWAKQLTDKEAKDYTIDNIFLSENASAAPETKWYQQIPVKQFEWPSDKSKQ